MLHTWHRGHRPNQSLLGLVEHLGRYRFRVIGKASPDDHAGQWITLRGVEYLPLAPRRFWVAGLRRALRETPHDLLLTNGFFDHLFTFATLLLRAVGAVPRRPFMIAPRGEFASPALRISPTRKLAYKIITQWFGVLRGVRFQSSGESETREIRRALGSVPVVLAPNVRTLRSMPRFVPRDEGAPLRVAFLSRIDRMKNLDFVIHVLARVSSPVHLSIYGPVSDEAYWRTCKRAAADLPSHVSATYEGPVPNANVLKTLASTDLFFLPSRRESYGHAILDALEAGTPVLLSDTTPWGRVNKALAGWALPLGAPEGFVCVIDQLASQSPLSGLRRRKAARKFAERIIAESGAINITNQAFAALIATSAVASRQSLLEPEAA